MIARLQTHWREKLLLTVVLNALFWTGYEWLGRTPMLPVRTVPRLWPDDAIPFQPRPWAWVYLSQFLLTGLLPWLIDSRETIRRYVVGFAVMSGTSFAVFAVWPVASPRPAGPVDGALAAIHFYDGTLNAFPSLHAAFLVYMARLAWRMFGRGLSPVKWGAGAAWGAAILYATIATRQHFTLDLVAGGAIGWLADWRAWRTQPTTAAQKIARSSGAASHDGSR